MNESRQLSAYVRFTGGDSKTPDMTIFYNVAMTNMEKIVNHYERREVNLTNEREVADLADGTFNLLAEYLWKAHTDAKNPTEGYLLDDHHRTIIRALIGKLNHIRNYHSHIWHDNAPLAFDHSLVKFVKEKYERAIAKGCEKFPGAVADFEALREKGRDKFFLFKKHDGQDFITAEGRIFFLSFFLTTGQMSSFLQQRAGSKRADVPMYKIKRFAYTALCHRDGASILGFHQQESVLGGMDAGERRNILLARQAYKLISYLHDYPEYLADNSLMSPMVAGEAGGGKLRKAATTPDLVAFISAKRLLPKCRFSPIMYRLAAEDEKEAKELERTGTVLMHYEGIEDYDFQINFETLYKLVMVSLKYGEPAVKTLGDNLVRLAASRRKLYEALCRVGKKPEPDDSATLAEKENQYLRGSRKLGEHGIAFFEHFARKHEATPQSSIKLANYLRPKNAAWRRPPPKKRYRSDPQVAHEPEPITVFAQDFIEKTEQKFRRGNRFMFYAAHYLMDHAVVNDWYWEVEKFEMRAHAPGDESMRGIVETSQPRATEQLVKVKEFQHEVQDGYRLCIDADHVTVGIPKTPAADITGLDPKRRSEAFYQFRIGPRAMRYLLAFHILSDGRCDLNGFLAEGLAADYAELMRYPQDASRQFRYLEEQFLPGYLQTARADTGTAALMEKVKKRVAHIIAGWDKAKEEKRQLKRSEKNRIIMDCYRLFEWPMDKHGREKFLRAQEYNYMSVCHYSLMHKERKPGERMSRLEHYYKELFRLKSRTPPVPPAVSDLLWAARDLDDLMEKAIASRRLYLTGQMDVMEGLPARPKKEKLAALARKLGIPVGGNMLNEAGREGLAARQAHTLQVLPFAVHPMLAVKYFAPELWKADYKKPGQHEQGEKPNGILARLRTAEYTAGLYPGHYETEFLGSLTAAGESCAAAFEKLRDKWTGIVNTTLTEDAILWWAARRYLAANDRTKAMAQALPHNLQGMHVGSLYSHEITVALPQGTGPFDRDDTSPELFMSMKMHQLDDVMYAADQGKLRKAALHYLLRHTSEKEYWAGPDAAAAPHTGAAADQLPYEELRREIALAARNGMALAGYLLDLERRILNGCTAGMTDAEKHQFLLSCSPAPGGDTYAHVNFAGVMKLAKQPGELRKELTAVRNKCFHDDIPIKETYSYWARPGSVAGGLLMVTEPLHSRKDKERFQPGSGMK